MREIDKTIILMISKIIGSANIFVLSIFFARMVSKADYGTYTQMNMLIGLLVLLLSLGIPPSMFYYLPKDCNHRQLIYRTFFFLFFIGCINMLVMYVLRDFIGALLNNHELSRFAFLTGFCIMCRMVFNLIQPVLLVLKESIFLAAITSFKGILLFVSMSVCLFMKTGITVLIYVFCANSLVELAISLYVIVHYTDYFGKKYNELIVPLKDQIKFALPLALSGAMWILGRELDKLIISHYLTPEDLAVYARGAVEIPLVHIFSATIAQVYLPDWVGLFDRKEFGTMIEKWHLTVTKTALIMFPVFMLFQIIGHDFIVMMYSNNYSGSVLIFSIFLFMVPMQLTEYTAVIESSGKTFLISFGYFFQISLNMIFGILLLKKLGSAGPALMTVCSMYLWAAYMLFVISRIFKVSFFRVFPWIKLLRIMAICLFVATIPYGLRSWLDNLGFFNFFLKEELNLFVRIVFASIIFSVLYLIALYVTKTLDHDDKEAIIRWMMLRKLKIVK